MEIQREFKLPLKTSYLPSLISSPNRNDEKELEKMQETIASLNICLQGEHYNMKAKRVRKIKLPSRNYELSQQCHRPITTAHSANQQRSERVAVSPNVENSSFVNKNRFSPNGKIKQIFNVCAQIEDKLKLNQNKLKDMRSIKRSSEANRRSKKVVVEHLETIEEIRKRREGIFLIDEKGVKRFISKSPDNFFFLTKMVDKTSSSILANEHTGLLRKLMVKRDVTTGVNYTKETKKIIRNGGMLTINVVE